MTSGRRRRAGSLPARPDRKRRTARNCRRNPCRLPVEPVAVEITRLVDQVHRDVRSGQPALVHVTLDRPGADRDSKGDSRGGQARRRRTRRDDSRAGIPPTEWPCFARARGKAPATSPSPPVLANGTASEATKTTFIPGQLPARKDVGPCESREGEAFFLRSPCLEIACSDHHVTHGLETIRRGQVVRWIARDSPAGQDRSKSQTTLATWEGPERDETFVLNPYLENRRSMSKEASTIAPSAMPSIVT